jgi:hypothetical protein
VRSIIADVLDHVFREVVGHALIRQRERPGDIKVGDRPVGRLQVGAEPSRSTMRPGAENNFRDLVAGQIAPQFRSLESSFRHH